MGSTWPKAHVAASVRLSKSANPTHSLARVHNTPPQAQHLQHRPPATHHTHTSQHTRALGAGASSLSLSLSQKQLFVKTLRTYLDFGVVSGHFHRGGMPAGHRASGRRERRAHEEGIRAEHEAGESEYPSEHHRDGEVE